MHVLVLDDMMIYVRLARAYYSRTHMHHHFCAHCINYLNSAGRPNPNSVSVPPPNFGSNKAFIVTAN